MFNNYIATLPDGREFYISARSKAEAVTRVYRILFGRVNPSDIFVRRA